MGSVSIVVPVALALGMLAGCAHAPQDGPALASVDESEAGLRRDNATLRRRVQMLEDRVLRLERHADGTVAPAASYDGSVGGKQKLPDGRELPVIRLGEAERDPALTRDEKPRTAAQGPRTLEGLPKTNELDDDRLWSDPSGYDVEEQADADPDKRFRLVGQELVRMTEPDRVKPADRKPTGVKGKKLETRYGAAIELYRAAQYAEAEAEFESIANEFPKSDYADNAWYWKGEAAYDQEHFSDALAAFTAVVERYGGGNKAPDALLKIGLCYDKLGDRANARDVLSQLVSAYPGATASDIARARLAELGT
jgi:tol-pal system protein YbgF